jgi:hypothetical protein
MDAKTPAAHGYPAMALAYFHEAGLPVALHRIPLDYFAAGVIAPSGAPNQSSTALWPSLSRRESSPTSCEMTSSALGSS